MYAVVRQMRTDPLHLFSPRLSLPDPDEEAIGHMLLCYRCKREERRPEWRGGVISWQKLISALSPWGETMLYSPPFAKAARDTEREEVRREKGGGVQSWHTLLSSPRLLAGKLSDTTDYSSHYSQRLTSVSVCECVGLCVYEWPHIHS